MRRIMRIVPWACLLLLVLPGCRTIQRRLAARATKRPPYYKVTPPIAFEMMRDSPEILILDLRSPQAFNGDTGHLFRAQNIPLERLPYRLLELSAYRDDTFLVYCDAPTCAEEGMAVLISSGFEDAVLMQGGIDAWIADGFRTVLPSDAAGRAEERTAAERAAGRQTPPPTAPAAKLENAVPPP